MFLSVKFTSIRRLCVSKKKQSSTSAGCSVRLDSLIIEKRKAWTYSYSRVPETFDEGTRFASKTSTVQMFTNSIFRNGAVGSFEVKENGNSTFPLNKSFTLTDKCFKADKRSVVVWSVNMMYNTSALNGIQSVHGGRVYTRCNWGKLPTFRTEHLIVYTVQMNLLCSIICGILCL